MIERRRVRERKAEGERVRMNDRLRDIAREGDIRKREREVKGIEREK
jgi:hypothetical protein